MWLQVGPTYWIKSSHHLVLGRPRGLFVFTVYPFCDSDCPSLVTSPRHVASPSVFAFSYAPDNISHNTLFPDPVCTLPILQGDSYHDSVHLALSCDQFLKLGVAKWPCLTAICHYWEYTFVKGFSLMSVFLSRMMLSSFTECTPSLSDSLFHFFVFGHGP